MLFKSLYPGKFDLIWPSENEIRLTKRAFAKDIGKYTRQQIEEAVSYMASQAVEGVRECMEPNVLVFLKYASQLNTNRKMYQEFLPAPKENKEDREARRQLGLKKCSELKSLFE